MELANDAQLLTFMRNVEGFENKLYVDTVGLTSIGIGRNLTGRGLSDDEVLYLYANDVKLCEGVMDTQIPWWRNLNLDGQRAMISLCFMGWGSFSQFKMFLAAMQNCASCEQNLISGNDAFDYPHWIEQAHDQLQNSIWWSQVGQRGPLTLALIHTTAPATAAAVS